VLQVSGLTKRYRHLTALADVSFTIRPGEVLGLIGPNGSGKTTLFECLGGVLPADRGSVLEDGRPLTADECRRRVFYLPDGIAPWPAQSVRWALKFAIGFFGSSPSPSPSPSRGLSPGLTPSPSPSLSPGLTPGLTPTLDHVVRELDLEPLLDFTIGTLSKGQRKRVLLAIGLLTSQPVLLADEPFDGLDLRQMRDVAKTLRAHAATGRTLLLSIHQISDAARVCDRFVLLSGGRICGEGTIADLAALARHRQAQTAERGAGTSGRGDSDLEEVFLALT
jgi:ABC-2 type transport system ATP-binding protein